MRIIKVQNSRGEIYDITSLNAFFYEIDGFGIEINAEYQRIGNYFKTLSAENRQLNIEGTLSFINYKEYQEFAKFINHTPLKLIYKPLNEEYFVDVIIAKLSKGEIDKTTTRLECDIEFEKISDFYQNEVIYRSKPQINNSKKYNYTYPYQYIESTIGEIILYNEGNKPAASLLGINGPITNPTWLLEFENNIVMTGKVNYKIPMGHKLIINSKPDSLQIGLYTAENTFVEDLYIYSDKNTERFLSIPVGESLIKITGEEIESIDCYVEVLEQYATV